ncbi:MAG TPA: PIG-L family deacetylase, partial [Kofleriaceae bacterium]
TDGEGSHPNVPGLAEIRAHERDAALMELGCQPRLVRLAIPDGAVWQATDLADRIARELAGVSHVFAPLEFDGHPDHDAVGTAARDASARTESTLVRYAVWAWHWARVDRLPFERSAAITLDGGVRDRKRRAINAYRSQITMFEGIRILYPAMLDHFARPFETVFV